MRALLIVVVVILGGCQITDKPSSKAIVEAAGNIAYFRDARTGICFAAVNAITSAYATISISYVPCTPEVMKLSIDK